jgi:hypothetical protein
MRPAYSVAGMLLIMLGDLGLFIHSITYFTHEQVAGPLGFFAWDVSRPHTILFNPIAGVVAIAIGLALTLVPRHRAVT